MTSYEYLKVVLKTLREMSEQTGYPFSYLFRRFAACYAVHRVEVDEFRSLRMYDYAPRRVSEFLNFKETKRISDRLNAGATPEQILSFNDKHCFNALFGAFLRRQWLYLPDATLEELRAFLAENETFFAKACVSSQGYGIEKYRSAEVDPALFLEQQRGKSLVLEAAIRQHPLLDAVNPASVNTVRIVTARKGDHICPIGAGLRTGGAGQVVDNFHHGGTAYPLDLEAGIVTARGVDLDGNPVLRHPVTGYLMPGLQIPHWDVVLSIIRQAAVLVPNIGYVGWDLAITEDGAELIEGNINYPGNNIIQLDGPGARRRLLDFCAAEGIPVR